MQQRRPVHHALLSVSDKADIIGFAQALSAHGVELPPTGGTTRLLAGKGLPVTEVSDYTGLPEMIDGHVRILHPKVHGDILGRRGQGDRVMEQHGIAPIGMVIVSLYPFAETVAREGYSLEGTVENIDAGGPTMVRSAAKNHKDATIAVKSSDYDAIIKEVDANEGSLTLEACFGLAIKAFEHTAAYGNMIANYSGSMVPAYHGENREAAGHLPHTLNLSFIRKQDMRYDENSHQQAAFYIKENVKEASVTTAQQVQGKALSYNNIAGTGTALECVEEFSEPAYVIVKRANPYGVTVSTPIFDAHDRAYKADPTSTFGSIIAFNHELDAGTTQAVISRQFVEVIITPSATEDALKITATKRDVRILACSRWAQHVSGLDFKRVNDSLLIQDRDLEMASEGELRVVSKRQPTEQELCDALFCWKVAKFVKPNAIIYAKENMTIGIDTGRMSRVYSAKIAGIKAADEGLRVKDFAIASNAFFPFRDGTDVAAVIGVSCVIQPDDSIHDDEIIVAADEHGIAMIFTDMRHFRH